MKSDTEKDMVRLLGGLARGSLTNDSVTKTRPRDGRRAYSGKPEVWTCEQ